MKEIICPYCGRFIGVLDGEAQIKCPRCKQLATYKSHAAPHTERKPPASEEDEEIPVVN
ncbi:MAG: hypothetical protein GYA42_01950 [Syntrophomonadaceae bacterium]|nr:hypothetical protein [Syntrophomonadaceae bacterium]